MKFYSLWLALNILLLFSGIFFFILFIKNLFSKLFSKKKIYFIKNINKIVLGFSWDTEDIFHAISIKCFSHKDLSFYQSFPGQEHFCLIELQESSNILEYIKNYPLEKIVIELISTDINQLRFEFYSKNFLKQIEKTSLTKENFLSSFQTSTLNAIPEKKFIYEGSLEKRPFLVLESDPQFKKLLGAKKNDSERSEEVTTEKEVTFPINKVWIEPGCIVCNTCENIYPEVFDVKATTCVIKDQAPLDDGLKIQEAAEACPVEVIKFSR